MHLQHILKCSTKAHIRNGGDFSHVRDLLCLDYHRVTWQESTVYLSWVTMSWGEDTVLLALLNSKGVSTQRGNACTNEVLQKFAAQLIFLGGLRIIADIME